MSMHSLSGTQVKGMIENSFLKFDMSVLKWSVLQDFFTQYSCMGIHPQLLKETNKEACSSCVFSAPFQLNKKRHGLYFEGTVLQFLLCSEVNIDAMDPENPFWGKILRKSLVQWKNDVIKQPEYKTQKWTKLKILWNILLGNHSCTKSGCLKPQLDHNSFRIKHYPEKDSDEFENVFELRERDNDRNNDVYDSLINAFLENSIFQLFLLIENQKEKHQSGSDSSDVRNINNSDLTFTEDMQSVMEQIKYEIRCIKYFGTFVNKSVWGLFQEYFPKKVSGMIPSKWKSLKDSEVGSVFHGVIKATSFWEIFTELYYNHDRTNDEDSVMVSKILKQKDSHDNTVLHLLSEVSKAFSHI